MKVNTQQKPSRRSDLVAIEQGRWSYENGLPESKCPYAEPQIGQRCAWLAGYRDAERGLA